MVFDKPVLTEKEKAAAEKIAKLLNGYTAKEVQNVLYEANEILNASYVVVLDNQQKVHQEINVVPDRKLVLNKEQKKRVRKYFGGLLKFRKLESK